jgi:hypothetical protein
MKDRLGRGIRDVGRNKRASSGIRSVQATGAVAGVAQTNARNNWLSIGSYSTTEVVAFPSFSLNAAATGPGGRGINEKQTLTFRSICEILYL